MRNADYYKAKIADLKPLIEAGEAKEEDLRLLKHYEQELAEIEFRMNTLPGPVKTNMSPAEFGKVNAELHANYKAKREAWRGENPPHNYEPKGE